jgi:hypothetical protein
MIEQVNKLLSQPLSQSSESDCDSLLSVPHETNEQTVKEWEPPMEYKRKIFQSLMRQGMDFGPVKSPVIT